MLHECEGLARAESRGSGAKNGGCRIEVVAGDQLGALGTLHLEKAAQRHHLPLAVSGIEVLDVFRSHAVMIIGLDVDLVDLVELVEEVDEGGAQVAPERLEHVVQRDLKGLGLCPVDIQVELGAAGIEGSGQTPQVLLGVARLDQLHSSAFWRASRPIALPVFHHHLKTACLAQAPDGRRDHDKGDRFLDRGKIAVEAGNDLFLAQGRAPFTPVFIDDKCRVTIVDTLAASRMEKPPMVTQPAIPGFF